MGRAGTIARRTFMVGSVALMGGVAFGYYMYRKPAANPLLDDLQEGEAALTPYVLINADGITLITPRADSGQGAYSVQAMMIAEELDVDMDQVSVSPGVPSPAYYNTALAAESAPFRPTDRSTMANTTRGVMDAVMKFMGMQMTGGSTTVPDGYEKLRMAGAVARETLKMAAGKRTGQDPKQMTTESAHVILPDGTRIAYTDLAVEASQIEPADHLALRHHSRWRIMGKPQQRLDILAKSTGTLRYGIDFAPEGVVHATVRTNPRKGGAMNGYDAEAAKQMRGVKQVLPVTGGVAVVADNTWRAFAAADAIDIDWGDAPYPAEMEGAGRQFQRRSTGQPQTRRGRRGRGVRGHDRGDRGRIPRALSGARPAGAQQRHRSGGRRPRRCMVGYAGAALCAGQSGQADRHQRRQHPCACADDGRQLWSAAGD